MDKLKELLNKMNKSGIPVPTIKDPKHGVGSVSLTMVVVSFGVCVLGIIGKVSQFLGDVDMSQGLVLLTISCSLYFGRQMQSNNKTGQIDFSDKKAEEKVEPKDV
jgi:hypothetical protein